MSSTLSLDNIKQQLAEIFETQLGLPRERTLAGEAFVELDPNFDSLSLVQVQLFLEELYETRFERTGAVKLERLPANITELAEYVQPLLQRLLDAKQGHAL